MKKWFTVLFCGVISSAQAQSYNYFAIGYNASMLSSDGLNYVVDRYNETRTYLDVTMPHPQYFDGLAVRFGASPGVILADFGFTGQSCKVSASGVDVTATEVQRDLKDKWNTYDVGLGFNLLKRDNAIIALGANFGINSEKIYTRVDAPENIKDQDFELVQKTFKVGIAPFLQFMILGDNGSGLLLRPYYAWSPMPTDYAALNAAINPATYANDPETIEGTLTGFGVNITLVHVNWE